MHIKKENDGVRRLSGALPRFSYVAYVMALMEIFPVSRMP